MKTRIVEWIMFHQRQLFGALAGFVALIALVGGAALWQQHRQSAAFEALSHADNDPLALQKVMQEFSHTQAALLALWQLGDSQLTASKSEEALASYQKLYEKGDTALLKVVALYGIAAVHQSKKEFREAAEGYQRAGQEPGNLVTQYSQYLAGRYFELAGDAEKANTVYQTLSQGADLSEDLKEKITERQIWLALQK